MPTKLRSLQESIVARLLFVAGLLSVILVCLIFVFVLKEGLPLFKSVSLYTFLFGRDWQPALSPPLFGLLPSLWGTLLVTLGASILAIPLGITTAMFIAEVAPKRLRSMLKSMIELLSLLPSVAIGFVGVVAVGPVIKSWLGMDTAKSAIVGALMLALLALPTIITIAEDAIHAVPRVYRDSSLAVGATHWQGISRVVVPAALPGILAAVALGIGRAVGETMVVIMLTGNAGLLPEHGLWYAFTHSVRTITGTIGAEALEVANGEPHYHALFMLGAVLFGVTFLLNFAANKALGRQMLGVRR